MLEPYYQVTLEREGNTYSYKFRVPQRLGIFRFVVDYTRYGLSFLDEQSHVSIIQWRHDAFPRYLVRAYPFYLSVMVLIGAFFIFIVGFLFSELKKGQSVVAPAVSDKKKGDKKE
jgi:oligosaccharyltransferase complex subunit beta